jgi:hypothetical protein
MIAVGAGCLVIGLWVILYYATSQDKKYEEIAAKQIDKDLEELKNKPKNQTVKTDFTDDDVPF